MDKIVLDANVVAKILVKETNTEAAEKLLEVLLINDIKIIAPHLLKIEIYSVIRKKNVLTELTYSQAEKVLNIFEEIPIITYKSSHKTLSLAYDLANELEQTVIYDTLYLATAITKNAYFVTEDTKLLNKIKKSYKHVYTINEALRLLNDSPKPTQINK